MNDSKYLDIGGSVYIIDLVAMDKLLMFDNGSKTTTETETVSNFDANGKLISTTVTTKEKEKNKEIDGTKYDMIRVFFEVLLSFNDEFDDSLGFERAISEAPLPFKISFNSLTKEGILKEI
jgi:hypothetical protein